MRLIAPVLLWLLHVPVQQRGATIVWSLLRPAQRPFDRDLIRWPIGTEHLHAPVLLQGVRVAHFCSGTRMLEHWAGLQHTSSLCRT